MPHYAETESIKKGEGKISHSILLPVLTAVGQGQKYPAIFLFYRKIQTCSLYTTLYSKCLTWISEFQTFVCLVFRHIRCLKSEQIVQISDTFLRKNCLKTELLGNQTVIECLKSQTFNVNTMHPLAMILIYKATIIGFKLDQLSYGKQRLTHITLFVAIMLHPESQKVGTLKSRNLWRKKNCCRSVLLIERVRSLNKLLLWLRVIYPTMQFYLNNLAT